MKYISVSQSEREMGRNRGNRRLIAMIDSQTNRSEVKSLTQNLDLESSSNSDIKLPDITFCKYLGKCPIPTRKKCMFNSGYENCNIYKFYEKWK